MQLEDKQEVWVRAIVTGNRPWKRYEDKSSSWFVRIADHYQSESGTSVCVKDEDILTKPEEVPSEPDDWVPEFFHELDQLVISIGETHGLAAGNEKRLCQLERDMETHNEVITGIQKGAGYPSSVVKEWDNPYDDAAWNAEWDGHSHDPEEGWVRDCPRCNPYEPPKVDNVCRVCDKPIGHGRLYCHGHAPPLIRTGEEIINSM